MPTITTSPTFNLNSLQLIFGDTTDYGALGISGANVMGNLKATGPSGIFHNGTSWVSPDILISTGTTVTVTLPSASGIALSGTYTFDYTTRITSTFTLPTLTNPTYFVLPAAQGDQTALFVAGLVFTITGGQNPGTYSVASSSFNGTTTTVNINQSFPFPTSVQGGTISFTTDYLTTTSYYFSDCQPVANLELEPDCGCTSITSMDLTNYTVYVNGNYYAPTTTARTHVVNSPISPSTGQSVAGTSTSSDATIIVSPLWTGIWISTISTVLTYNLDGLLIIKTVTGSATVTVECSDELCCAFQCIKNISDTYNEYKETNPVLAEKWQKKVIEVSIQWTIYSLATQCAKTTEAEEAITAIIDITKTAGCNCCTDTSAEPALVVGLCGTISTSGSGGNTHVASCGNGITVTPSTTGSTTTYTVCLDVDIVGGIIADYLTDNPINFSELGDVLFTSLGSGDLVRYNGVNWVNVDSISINQITEFIINNPTIGQVPVWNGTHFVNANNTGAIVEIATSTYTNVGTPTQTLRSVNLSTSIFPANGDFIRVQSEWLVSGDVNAKSIIFAIGGLDFAVTALTAANIRRVFYNFDIIRVSATTVRIRRAYTTYGNVSGIAYPLLSDEISYADPLNYTVLDMDTLDNTLAFRCDPTASGSTITLADYTVLSFKG